MSKVPHFDDTRRIPSNVEPKLRAAVSTQNYKPVLKENQSTGYSPAFRPKDNTASPVRLQADLQDKLQSIRKKYQNHIGSASNQKNREVSPLKEANHHFKEPTPHLTAYQPSSLSPRQNISRSFSFVGFEDLTAIKPQQYKVQEESFVEPALQTNGFGLSERRASVLVGNSRPYQYQTNLDKLRKTIESKPQPQLSGGYKRVEEPFAKDKTQLYSKDRQEEARTPPTGNLIESYVKSTPILADGERIESIDKINCRIKEILKSINDNDSQHLSTYRKYGYELESKEPSQNKLYSPIQKVNNPEPKYSHSKSINVESSQSNKHYDRHVSFNSSPYTSKFDSESKAAAPKYEGAVAKECRTGIGCEGAYTQRSITFRNPTTEVRTVEPVSKSIPKEHQIKDLDLEIQKIQEKIKKTEEQKRKLWMEEAKYKNTATQLVSDANSKSSHKIGILRQQTTVNKPPTGIDTGKNVKSTARYLPSDASARYDLQTKRNSIDYVGRQVNSTNKELYTRENNYRGRYKDTEYKPRNTQHVPIPKAQELSIKIVPVSCESETEQSKCGDETKRFIACLKEQVECDEEFRNAKIWLNNCEDSEKWLQVQQEFERRGVRMGVQEVEREFSNSLEEHNPFYSSRNYNETVSSVVEKYLRAQQYWKTHFVKQFNTRQMREERFEEGKLDLEKKGYLTVEDFVRFLNIETGTFYRNRDLILLFRRMTSAETITFSDFIAIISK